MNFKLNNDLLYIISESELNITNSIFANKDLLEFCKVAPFFLSHVSIYVRLKVAIIPSKRFH
jgi:hypothetical protein